MFFFPEPTLQLGAVCYHHIYICSSARMCSENRVSSARAGECCTPVWYRHRSQNQRMVISSNMTVHRRPQRPNPVGEDQAIA